MTKQHQPAGVEAPLPPPYPPLQAGEVQDRDDEIARLLEEAERRGREEPGSITVLVPSRREKPD